MVCWLVAVFVQLIYGCWYAVAHISPSNSMYSILIQGLWKSFSMLAKFGVSRSA